MQAIVTINPTSFRLFASCILLTVLATASAQADTFGIGVNTFSIPFVTIGSPGNAPDTTGTPNPAGAVDYVYRIGQFEISEDAVRKANTQSALEGNPLSITLADRADDNAPATGVTWFEAARFVNYLNTSTGNAPAYKFDDSGNFELHQIGDAGFNPDNPFRSSLARYFLPSADEWYKAAYYDPVAETYFDFPTGSDTAPRAVTSGTAPGTSVFRGNGVFALSPATVTLAGGASPFGTVGQGGNVSEWEETTFDLLNASSSSPRGNRGGGSFSSVNALSSSFRFSNAPTTELSNLGFRVASIPEPCSLFLISLSSARILLLRRR